jgi:hypothetical protein
MKAVFFLTVCVGLAFSAPVQGQRYLTEGSRNALQDYGPGITQGRVRALAAQILLGFRAAERRYELLSARLDAIGAKESVQPGSRYELAFMELRSEAAALSSADAYARALQSLLDRAKAGETFDGSAFFLLQESQIVLVSLNQALRQMERRCGLMDARTSPGEGRIRISPDRPPYRY